MHCGWSVRESAEEQGQAAVPAFGTQHSHCTQTATSVPPILVIPKVLTSGRTEMSPGDTKKEYKKWDILRIVCMYCVACTPMTPHLET